TGTLDGNGFTISNLTINSSSGGGEGLFYGIGTGGAARKPTVFNARLNDPTAFSARVLCALNKGSIQGVSVSGVINPFSGGSAGGVVGQNLGSITQSHAAATITVGQSGSGADAGGLVGDNYGQITFSYATGTVSSVGSNPNANF